MNKTEMIALFEAFVIAMRGISITIERQDAVFLAGGACVLLGVREHTSDIDLAVSPRIYAQMSEKGLPTIAFNGHTVYTWGDDVECGPSYGGGTSCVVDGYHAQTPAALLAFKQECAALPDRAPEKREQDLRDIERLRLLL